MRVVRDKNMYREFSQVVKALVVSSWWILVNNGNVLNLTHYFQFRVLQEKS